jgi:hypothetical protein
MDQKQTEGIFKRLGKLESVMSLIYNIDVDPPDGILVRLEKKINNDLCHRLSQGNRWFEIFKIVLNAIIVVLLSLLLLKLKP